jgi:hypothetical protein
MLVSKYKVEIKEEPGFADETFEERYARITAFDQTVTTVYVISRLSSHLTNALLVLSVCLWYLKGDRRVLFFIFWPFSFLCHYRCGSLLAVPNPCPWFLGFQLYSSSLYWPADIALTALSVLAVNTILMIYFYKVPEQTPLGSFLLH